MQMRRRCACWKTQSLYLNVTISLRIPVPPVITNSYRRDHHAENAGRLRYNPNCSAGKKANAAINDRGQDRAANEIRRDGPLKSIYRKIRIGKHAPRENINVWIIVVIANATVAGWGIDDAVIQHKRYLF